MLQNKPKGLQIYSGNTFQSLEPAVGVGSKNPLFGYDLVPLASYVVNFKSLGPKLWKFFPDIDQIGPVKYKSKSIDDSITW